MSKIESENSIIHHNTSANESKFKKVKFQTLRLDDYKSKNQSSQEDFNQELHLTKKVKTNDQVQQNNTIEIENSNTLNQENILNFFSLISEDNQENCIKKGCPDYMQIQFQTQEEQTQSHTIEDYKRIKFQ